MLRRTALLAAAAAPLLFPVLNGPAAPSQEERGGQEEEVVEEEEEDPLDEAMMRLKGGTRALRGLMAREDLDACLRIVSDMQAATILAKGEVPHTAEEQPEEARADFVADYRRTLLTLLESLIALERAFLDGDAEAAKAIFDERVRPMEKEGHQRFKNSSRW